MPEEETRNPFQEVNQRLPATHLKSARLPIIENVRYEVEMCP